MDMPSRFHQLERVAVVLAKTGRIVATDPKAAASLRPINANAPITAYPPGRSAFVRRAT
jgi:hypothetical protein